jgi:phosphatidylethanolamine/phosphatidyl-N-methylethanolamine N-methyltransferase
MRGELKRMSMFFSPDAKAKRRSKLFFLKQYFRNPLGVGAVAPSSQKLANFIVSMLAPQPSDVVVELGPGTGVFTRELLSQGVAPANLILVEFNGQFVKFLKGEFPHVKIIEGAGQDLPQLLKALGQGPVKKIISGIPLRSLKPSERQQIAKAVAATLEPGGVFVQFSYFKTSPFSEEVAAEVGLVGKCAGAAMSNVPPAYVWRYIKQA